MESVFFTAFLCLFCVCRPARIKYNRETSSEDRMCREQGKERYAKEISRKSKCRKGFESR